MSEIFCEIYIKDQFSEHGLYILASEQVNIDQICSYSISSIYLHKYKNYVNIVTPERFCRM